MVRYGDIVLIAGMLDPNGRNPKDRPAVVVTPTSEITEGLPLEVVAISTLIPDPLPPDHVLLPWSLPRHPRTGLNKRCAAICSWIEDVDEGRIIRRVGVVPVRELAQIIAILRDQAG